MAVVSKNEVSETPPVITGQISSPQAQLVTSKPWTSLKNTNFSVYVTPNVVKQNFLRNFSG
jgi:hypothetical protein